MTKIAKFSQKSPKFSLMSNGMIYTIGRPLKIFRISKFLIKFPVIFHFRQPEVTKIAKFSQKAPKFSLMSNGKIYTIGRPLKIFIIFNLGGVYMEAGQPGYPSQPGYPRSRVPGLAIVKVKSVYMINGLEPGWKRASPHPRDLGFQTGIPGVRAGFFPM